MLASTRTFTLTGIEAREVVVEVDVRAGLGAFSVVGLPDAAVRESRERVRAAIENLGLRFPRQRITVNLAPADLRKGGPAIDLAIAAGLLAAVGELEPAALAGCALAGELALDGSLRAVPGALAMAEQAKALGLARFAVAEPSAPEAALAVTASANAGFDGTGAGANGAGTNGTASLRVVPVRRLDELRLLGTPGEPSAPAAPEDTWHGERPDCPDLADLRGQPVLRRALEVAAAGGHGLLVVGPPGAGKSLAARRLPSIMPPLTAEERLDVLRVASACGRLGGGPVRRPFRAPHHTVSPAGLVGGGTPPRAGEVTLAHRGVLFLDELSEFSRVALEALRQPLEDGAVTITRARSAVTLPCRFLLVAAANPCPCGHGEDSPDCECSPLAARRYRARVSGALADRIDLTLAVGQPGPEALAGGPGEGSAAVRRRVAAARERMLARQGCPNGELGPGGLRRHARLSAEARGVLAAAHRLAGLSGRGHDRVRRVARTLADLRGSATVEADDVAGALALRRRSGA